MGSHGALDEAGDGDGGGLETEPTFFGARDGVDVVGEPGEALDLVAEEGPGVAVLWGDPVLDSLEVGAQSCDRCTKFVGEVGEQTSAGVCGARELPRHRVERDGQRVQLGARVADGDAGAVVPAGDVRSGLGQRRDRGLEPAGEVPVDHQRDDDGCRHRQPERDRVGGAQRFLDVLELGGFGVWGLGSGVALSMCS